METQVLMDTSVKKCLLSMKSGFCVNSELVFVFTLSSLFTLWYPPRMAFRWINRCFQLYYPPTVGISWIPPHHIPQKSITTYISNN